MKGILGRQKGQPQTPKMKLAGQRNWNRMQVIAAAATLERFARLHCCYTGDLDIFISHSKDKLLILIDLEWQREQRKLQEQQPTTPLWTEEMEAAYQQHVNEGRIY